MRWANRLCCCLFLAFVVAGAGAPLHATDLKSPHKTYPDERLNADDGPTADDVVEFCYGQRRICRKVCYLRFRDDLIGCPQSCDSRVSRCATTGCYRWSEAEIIIAGRFGGYQCPSR
ncbi:MULTISPECIES: hypothetical protein [Rhodomicrobium]|uniref:hypothetical protein n=1 Tax=Rhodomicrobium TaxID=1068 RepID=UPI000F74B545|nr:MULTISPECIES: hypothetical protein [Rhodomicrobium]